MKIFLGANFTGVQNRDRLETIRNILTELGHKVFVGPIDVDNYGKKPVHPTEFMKIVFGEIKKSDLCIFKLRNKSTGVGIEAGYAKALGKRIIVLYPEGHETSHTLEEISDKIIEYKNTEELKEKLAGISKIS